MARPHPEVAVARAAPARRVRAFALAVAACAAVALGLGAPRPAGADDLLEVRAEAGLAGQVRPFRWSYALFHLKNAGPEFHGEACVLGAGETVEYTVPVEIPSHATRRIEVPFRPGPSPGRVLFRLRRTPGGEPVWSGEAGLTEVRPDCHLVLLPSERGVELARPFHREEAADSSNLIARVMAGRELPTEVGGYEAVRVVVLGMSECGSLSAEQGRALACWVRLGGHLVFAWEPGWRPGTVAADEAAPPFVPAGAAPLPDLRDFRAFDPSPPEAAGVLVAGGTPAPGSETLFACRGVPLVVRRRLGAGLVTWMGLDLAREPWPHWKGTLALWRRALSIPAPPPRNAGAFKSFLDEPPELWSAQDENARVRSALARAANQAVGWIAPEYLLLFTGTYVLAIGPGVHYLFRRRRRALAFLALPVTMALFAGVAYEATRRLHRVEECGCVLSVVDVRPGGDGSRGAAYGLVLFPRNESVRIATSGPGARLAPFGNLLRLGPSTLALGWSSVRTSSRASREGTELSFVARPWIPEQFELDWEAPGSALVTARRVFDARGASLAVENRSDDSLHGVVFVKDGAVLEVADRVPPGEHRFSLEGRPAVPLRAWLRKICPPEDAVGGWTRALLEIGVLGPAERPWETPEEALRKLASPPGTLRVFDPGLAAGRRSVLLAWSEAPPLPLRLFPLGRQPRAVTLYRVELEAP